MFVSMVDIPAGGPLSLRADEDWKKRFNVAASRAKDQMWVVYSVDPQTDLKPGDLRKQLIDHALDPQAIMRSLAVAVARAESTLEVAVVKRLHGAGYRARPQHEVGHYRIDIVVEGRTVDGRTPRLAVECDGDRYHPLEKLAEDLARQEVLERMGWRFVRIRGSSFGLDPDVAMQPVFDALVELGIEPLGPEIDKRDDPRETELIARVIRRAAELRSAWAVEEPETPDAEGGSQRFGGWRRRKQAKEPDVPAEPTQRMRPTEAAPSPPLPVQPSPPIARAELLTPGERQAHTQPALAALLSRYSLKSIDGRPKGDPLYVYADDSDPELSKQLRALRFTYKRPEKRWWTRERGNL